MSNKKENHIKKTKYGRASIQPNGYYKIITSKEGNVGKLLHKLIWEDHYGPIPEGDYVVHHIDDNKLNNDISNLELMTRAEHAFHHHKDSTRSDETCKNISKALKGKYCGEKSHNWKGYVRVVKSGFQNGKQNYILFDKNGERVCESVYEDKLKELAKKLDDGIITIEKIKEISKEMKSKVNVKNKARVVKGGITPQGKQNYTLFNKNGKYVKSSIFKDKLLKEMEELNKK